MDYNALAIILTSLFFSALFSGIEIAYISANKLQIELLSTKGESQGKFLSFVTRKPSYFIGMTLIGNNIALVVYGIFMAVLISPWLQAALPPPLQSSIVVLTIQTLISTVIVLATAEFLPKSIFLINPDWFLNVLAIPIAVIYVILFPFVAVITELSKFVITKLFGLEYSEEQPVFGLTDLNHYIQSTLGLSDEEAQTEVDTRMFYNALEFKAIKVRECMIPRTEIEALDITDSMEDLRKAFADSGYSKIVVYQDSIDDVIGYCHSTELFKKPRKIKDILTSIMIVPETMLANELLIRFITSHKNMALVVDEFGGTSGIVTMEDIIEEIFGEIQDEHDDEDLAEDQIEDNSWLLSARHEIDYLNEKYNWDLPTGEYDTLGGYILSITEDIPDLEDEIKAPPFTFTIRSMDENRIDLVYVEYHPVQSES